MSEIDYNNLTDEELAQIDFSNVEVDWDGSATKAEAHTQAEPTTQSEQSDTGSATAEEQMTTQEAQDTGVAEDVDDTDTATQESDSADDAQSDGTEASETEEQPQAEDVDYQAFYNELTKPFRANGREIQVKQANDIIALMQQGANYSKKMAALKPNLALVKALEQHGLNDVNKLGYLVDLYNKKPEAIAKLVKEADIDLYSFDTEQAETYTPQLQVNEPSAVEDTINELVENVPEFREVLSNISTQWDSQSKDTVIQNPEILRVMASQAQSGLYQQILSALDYERMLGRMVHTPFLQAYSELEARILANQSNANPAQNQSFTAPRPTEQSQVNAEPNKANKRKAAQTPKAAAAKGGNDFDPLKLSDEEFLKYYQQLQFH